MGWPGPMTDRQFRAWQAWMRADLNAPDKVCTYIMVAALQAARSNAVNPGSIQLDDMRVKFEDPPTPEEEAAWAKAKWHSALYTGKYERD